MKKIYTIKFTDIEDKERKYIFTFSTKSIKEIEKKFECSIFGQEFGNKMASIDMDKVSFLFHVGLLFAQPTITEEEADEVFSYFLDDFGIGGAIELVSTMLGEFIGNTDTKKKINL